MAVEVFKLFGSIFVDNEKANQSLHKTDKKASGVAGTLGKGIKTAAKWGAAILGGATVAAGGLFKVAKGSAETGDHIDKMSQKIGISRKTYQELDFICSQTGTSVDSFKNGLKTMRSVMDSTALGTSKNKTALERLGVAATDTKGQLRKSEDVMWDSLKALQNMKNETERARLASMLFGKSGSDLAPLLNNSSKSIDEMKKKAHDLGLVLSDDAIDNSVKFNDTLDQTKRVGKAFVTNLGATILPFFTKLFKGAQKYIPKIKTFFNKASPVIEKIFKGLIPPLVNLGKSIFPILLNLLKVISPAISDIVTTVMPIITQIIQMLLPPLIEIIKTLLPPLMEIVKALLPLLKTLFDLLSPIINLVVQLLKPIAKLISDAIAPLVKMLAKMLNELLKPFIPIIKEFAKVWIDALAPVIKAMNPVFKALGDILKPILKVYTSLLKIVLPKLVPVIKTVAKVFSGVLGNQIKGVAALLKGLVKVFTGLTDFISGVFTGNWKKAWKGVKKIFKGVWDAFYGIAKTPINLIIKGINWLWSGIYKAVKGIVDSIGKVAGALGKLFGQNWSFKMPKKPPTIPELEEGGVLKKGQVGVLEGKGDEAVLPLSRNTEWINKISDRLFGNISQKGLFVKEDKEKTAPVNININISDVHIKNEDDIRPLAEKLSVILADMIISKKGAFS